MDKIKLLNDRIAELDKQSKILDELKPMGADLQQKQIEIKKNIEDAKQICLKEKNIRLEYKALADKQTEIQNKLTSGKKEYEEAKIAHEKLKNSFNAIHPNCYNKLTNSLDINKLSKSERELYEASRINRENIAIENIKNEQIADELKIIKEKVQKRFNELLSSNSPLYNKPSSEDTKGVANPCIPCIQANINELVSGVQKEQIKSAKIKSDFPRKQHYNNCGIQSSGYLMKLVSCPGDIQGLDEDALFDDSIASKDANNIPLASSNSDPKLTLAQQRFKSGGTSPKGREAIMNKKGVSTTQIDYSSAALGNQLKNNKPVILSVNAYSLKNAKDDDGKPYATVWEKYKGTDHAAHAVTAVNAKFDKDGKMTDVLISDTGGGQQYWMSVNDLDTAVANHPNVVRQKKELLAAGRSANNVTTKMNVSSKPIKTDCK